MMARMPITVRGAEPPSPDGRIETRELPPEGDEPGDADPARPPPIR
jgi:hypothetical protein